MLCEVEMFDYIEMKDLFYFTFWDRISLCNRGWPETCGRDPLPPLGLVLKACAAWAGWVNHVDVIKEV